MARTGKATTSIEWMGGRNGQRATDETLRVGCDMRHFGAGTQRLPAQVVS
jgi:hypothetical protein